MIERLVDVQLDRPVLIMVLDGWIDAGLGAGQAMAALMDQIPTEPIARFDSDLLIDFRARRPIMHVEEGINTGLSWQEVQMRAGQDRAGNDVVLLVGPEPDMQWHAFTRAVVGLAGELGVRLVVGLGAFPAPVPHTRPLRVVSTATTPELAAEVGFMPGAIDVPSGIQSALERGFAEAGIPAVGLWARVPHYLANMPYPSAGAALVEALLRVAGLTVYAGDLLEAAQVTDARIAEMMANSEEHQAMVSQLEAQIDAAEPSATETGLGDLPTGDELAAELQRFLRDHGTPPTA